jgi:3-deoxy-alpha-D-manno-octulosonate 8-oxidase
VKKLGINSDYTPFDQVILDPDLTVGVPKNQWFYTGMDCFIHCVESLNGTFLNAFSQSYGEKAYDLCMEIFVENNLEDEDARGKLMMASWHGGMSIAYSQVGVAHAMSYGLSYVLGTKHGIGNCIVFDHLEEFYPKDVILFKKMVKEHDVEIPKGLCKNLEPKQIELMIDIALSLVPLWENALGDDWETIMTRDRLRALYVKM